MINSYIITDGGMSLVLNGKPFVIDSTHVRYDHIVDAVREKRWGDIPALYDVREVLQNALNDSPKFSAGQVRIELVNGNYAVTVNGEVSNDLIAQQILKLLEDNFDIKPWLLFVDRLMNNPSKKAIDELFGWMKHNGITVTEDGYMLAHKRVRNDYLSFFDAKTENHIGTYVEMPRGQVDDRSENTCSAGLHFCSQSYLPNYAGGEGRVLLLKIDPADVVSIPTDYTFAKGRASRYFVEGELTGSTRELVETTPVLTQRVGSVDSTNVEHDYKQGYSIGYKAGRGKQKNEYRRTKVRPNDRSYANGYLAGYADGRARAPKLY